jgi:predicted nucleotidyltransferase
VHRPTYSHKKVKQKQMNEPLKYSLKENKNSFLMQKILGISLQELEDICISWKITELALFGSILRADFTSDSDVDILVTFADDAQWGLMDFVRLNQQLETYRSFALTKEGKYADDVFRRCGSTRSARPLIKEKNNKTSE